MQLQAPVNIDNIDAQVATFSNLHVYKRNIPRHNATLVLVLDDRPVGIAIFSASAWFALLMLLLVMLSIKALHVTLRRRLVEPVEHLREAVEDDRLDDDAIHALEEELPDEAADILDVFGHLKHANDDIKYHLVDFMAALPACFWWSTNGRTYAGISEKCTEILNKSPHELKGNKLWAWIETAAQLSGNHSHTGWRYCA